LNIQRIGISEIDIIVPLIAKFRVELKAFKKIESCENLQSAIDEFNEYLNNNNPVFICKKEENFLGYCVCRVDEPVVWLESLYVLKEYRRMGVASALLRTAEELAASYGEDTLYNYVHPNNDAMIAFLNRNGYDTLNLIEIRKKHHGEVTNEQIRIRNNLFHY
jgi:ribosomal protein S18 acetylase RimI-like enzyme